MMGGGVTSTPAKSVRWVVVQVTVDRQLSVLGVVRLESTPSSFQRAPSLSVT